ncbi:MAG: pantoate--beta-alanine ligase [Candidatus Solibacter sp.]
MIHLSRTLADWQARRTALSGRTLGFVPTMGALHAGHAALVERARAENQNVAVSIFVNPSQFNDPNDLARYPNTLDADLHLLTTLGVSDVFLPTAADLYPHGYRYRIEPNTTPVLEGAFRPGHLQGVLTVVLKLLNLVRARRAYFGEKDFQQLQLVTELAEEFFIPTEIVPCPTVREASGLALSSRNLRLPPAARDRAATLYRALTTSATPAEARAVLEAAGFTVDYVDDRWDRRLAAAHLGGVRLIDNVPLSGISK